MWTLEQAIEAWRNVECMIAPYGWHAALGGGVLARGYSTHDLDLIVYAHTRGRGAVTDVVLSLSDLGWTRTHDAAAMIAHWREQGSCDTKRVESWRTLDGKRVDVIYPAEAG